MNQELLMTIITIVVFVAILSILWFTGKQGLVKGIILSLVIEAETYFASGEGVIKFNYVLSQVYTRLPMIIRFFVTSGMIEKWIEEGVDYIKNEVLKDGVTTIEESLNKEV